MIWAAMLGITEEVYEQLVKINPKYYEFSVYHLNHITLTNSFVSSISTASPSAGGGGAASIGGGGGSFGGGSGGGFR